MADPQIPITTIKYKTYVKKTLVEGLSAVFASHTDPFLAGMKVTIDFPMTEMDYPAVVVRFYEREITNAGIAHAEWSSVDNVYNDIETWFDAFDGLLRTAQDYKVKTGAAFPNGVLTSTLNEIVPWKPTYNMLSSTGMAATSRIDRHGNETVVSRTAVAVSLTSPLCFIGEVTVTGTNVITKIIYRDGAGVETVIGTTGTITAFPADQTFYSSFRLNYDGTLALTVSPTDPLVGGTPAWPTGNASATATAPQLASLTAANSYYSVGASSTGGTSKISLFRTFKTHITDFQLYKYKHYLYKGDIEFAVYALSSYDRDLVSDTLIQTLAMGDLENWTDQLGQRVYNPSSTTVPASLDHMININTDSIQGFGETQVIAPWNPEDVMVYQTSYRIGILGEFYSLTPTSKTYGLVENVDTFPYMGDIGDPVPTPGYAGPDHTYGTADDQVDPAPWT